VAYSSNHTGIRPFELWEVLWAIRLVRRVFRRDVVGNVRPVVRKPVLRKEKARRPRQANDVRYRPSNRISEPHRSQAERDR
jgi:hypothetical protein